MPPNERVDSMMSTRILIVNLHSSRNAGDAALLLAAIDQLRKSLPGCALTLAMNDPAGYMGDEHVVDSVLGLVKNNQGDGRSRWRWWVLPLLGWLLPAAWLCRWPRRSWFHFMPRRARRLLQAYCQADIVVSSPGGFLYSSGKFGLTLVIAVYTMVLAWAAGKPLYLLPQSIGPLEHVWERWLVGWILARARIVMVREAVSLAKAPVRGTAREHICQLPDMAWTFSAAPVLEGKAWLAAQGVRVDDGRPILGITAINWQAQKPGFQGQARYELALAMGARTFVEHFGGQVVFFAQVCGPTYDQDDRVPARRIISQASLQPEEVCLVDSWPSAAILKSAYGCMDVFIGTRMHSNIFALSMGVPVIAIGYQHKTLGIAQSVGLGDWVVDINTVEPAVLTDTLSALWHARSQIRSELTHRLQDVEREAAQAGWLVAADYATWKLSRR